MQAQHKPSRARSGRLNRPRKETSPRGTGVVPTGRGRHEAASPCERLGEVPYGRVWDLSHRTCLECLVVCDVALVLGRHRPAAAVGRLPFSPYDTSVQKRITVSGRGRPSCCPRLSPRRSPRPRIGCAQVGLAASAMPIRQDGGHLGDIVMLVARSAGKPHLHEPSRHHVDGIPAVGLLRPQRPDRRNSLENFHYFNPPPPVITLPLL